MNVSVDIVIPVLNEEDTLAQCIHNLNNFFSSRSDTHKINILIADNGSEDSTLDIANNLSKQYSNVNYIHLTQRGRGRALKAAWTKSMADIVSYMDVDLSTDLQSFPKLIEAISLEGYELAVGSRLLKDSIVVNRSPKREFLSRGYSLLFRILFFTGFKDAQCGFKAISSKVIHDIIPLIQDNGWFFDTELLILSEKNGYKIKEIPVIWTDDPDTRVKIFKTAYEDLKGLLRLRIWGLNKVSRILSSKLKE